MTHTTVDKFGRILLPKAVRKRLGLEPGMTIEIRVEEGRAVLEPPKAEARWEIREGGLPVWTGPLAPGADVTDLVRRSYEEREHRIRGRLRPR